MRSQSPSPTLLLLRFALVMALLLPASSHAQRQGRTHRTAAQAAASKAESSRAPATPPQSNGPSAPVPPGEPSPDPDPMLAPGALLLDVSTILIRAGEPFTVTVEVIGDPGPSAEGSTLSLQIDRALELLTGETEWTLPDVDASPFTEQITLAAPQARHGDVFKLTARINQTGFAPQERSVLLGVANDEPLSVLLDPLSARSGARAAIKELPIGDEGQPQLVRNWEIEALSRRGRRVAALAAPATLVFDARPLIAEGIDPTRLGLWTRSGDKDEWWPARSQYRADEQRFVARVDHFSQWGLGEKLTSESDLLPSSAVFSSAVFSSAVFSSDEFSSDEFSGYAGVNIPIAAPAGLGGMTPGLSLNYASGAADDLETIHGAAAYKAQANWVGYGWSLGGLSHISHSPDARYYNLVLGDVAVRIHRLDGRWVTEPERFLKIEHEVDWSGYDVPDVGHNRYDLDDWVITTSDGTVYHFGSNQFIPFNYVFSTHGDEPVGDWTEVIFHSRSGRHVRQGSRWHLRMVEDANGNRIVFIFDAEHGEFSCRDDSRGRVAFAGDDLLYDRMAYPSVIRWSANAGESVEPKLRVRFTREARPDHEIEKEECDQARLGMERLKTILIEAWDAPNGWHSIAEYEFGYIQSSHHSLLSIVTRRGKQGEQTLRSWRFDYQGSDNTARLTEADNGLGGSVSFSYGMEEIEDCHNCSSFSEHPMRRVVTEAVWRDGTGGAARSVYAYSGIKGHMRDGMFEYLGHAWSQRWRYTRDSDLNINNHRLEQVVESWYHQRLEEDDRRIDARRGRRKQRDIYAPEGDLLQREDISWGAAELRGDIRWVRKDGETVYTFDGAGNDEEDASTRVRHTRYFYESSYGNLVRVEERDAANKKVLRKTETEYSDDLTLIDRHIGDRPSREWISDERGRCIAETRYAYDANGNLIRSEQPTTHCGESDAANLIVSRLEYDGVGNVTRAWTEGTSHDIRTEFDDTFMLFPTRRYNANDDTLDETGRYYGINGADSRGEGGFWGAMQEFCAVNGVCTQQAYDDFGRASHRWAKAWATRTATRRRHSGATTPGAAWGRTPTSSSRRASRAARATSPENCTTASAS